MNVYLEQYLKFLYNNNIRKVIILYFLASSVLIIDLWLTGSEYLSNIL